MKKKYNKIEPFNDFWIDCYSTAIYSIMLSNFKVNRKYTLNNNYRYEFTQNVRTGMGRVYVVPDMEKILKAIFAKREFHDFTKDENIVEALKDYIDKGSMIFLGIDMFYGVPDTSQWNKHHIHHNILVEGYDDESECMYVLETGNSGYCEYEMTYEKITKAANEFVYFIHDSEICELTDKAPLLELNSNEIGRNAIGIIESIDNIYEQIDGIWHVNTEKLGSMRDEINAHLVAIRNRQSVNTKLFKAILDNGYRDFFIEETEKLYEEYNNLIITVNRVCENNTYYEAEKEIKEQLKLLLISEKKYWKKFIEVTM